MRFLYYPGCSMESNAKAYDESLQAVCRPLGVELEEIDDWNCCGATEYIGISLTPAYALIARNLALGAHQAQGADTVVSPCSACYLNLSKADHYMQESARLNENVNAALAAGGLQYVPGTLKVRHLLDVVVHDVGLDTVRRNVVRPLKGLRVAPYLGCMVPRPDYEKRWSNPEYPNELDLLLEALGAEVIDFPVKTHCCGGHMPHIGPSTAYELIRRLLYHADQYHADLLATLCPMCQLNLDVYQGETNRYFHTDYSIPVLFFTQLMGLAFGVEPKVLGIGRELVSAEAALSRIGSEVAPHEERRPTRQPAHPRKGALPMPRMPENEEASQ